jgi:hypothetical protein
MGVEFDKLGIQNFYFDVSDVGVVCMKTVYGKKFALTCLIIPVVLQRWVIKT